MARSRRGPARPAAAARTRCRCAATGIWRKRWRYLGAFCRRAAALRGAGPGRARWARRSGRSGTASAGELHERTRLTAPRLARGEVWTELAEGEHTGRIDWAPEQGGTLVRIEAAPRQDEERAGPRLPARRRGQLGRGGLPDRRGRRLRLDPQADRSRSTATCGSASGGSAARRAGSRTSPAAITPTTRSGTGRPGSARRPTAARSAGTWSAASTIRPQRSERAIWVDGEPSEPGPVDASRASRRSSSTAARLEFTRRGRAQQGGEQPWVELLLPPAVRHLHRHAARRARARRGPRRDGAPRRALVGAQPARDRDTTDSTRQRQGGSSPAANSYWLRPSRVSSATSAGTASSSSGVEASARDLAPSSPRRVTRSQPSAGR